VSFDGRASYVRTRTAVHGFFTLLCRHLSSEAIDSHRQLLSSRSLVIELVPTNNGLEIYNTKHRPSQREETMPTIVLNAEMS
jgi:hypothetical protein